MGAPPTAAELRQAADAVPVGQGPSVPALAAGAQPTAGLLEAVKPTANLAIQVLPVVAAQQAGHRVPGRAGAACRPGPVVGSAAVDWRVDRLVSRRSKRC